MYEVIIFVCTFVNGYSTDLECEQQKLSELPGCRVEISDPRLYHPTNNPSGDIFIKSVECRQMIPVAPKQTKGTASA